MIFEGHGKSEDIDAHATFSVQIAFAIREDSDKGEKWPIKGVTEDIDFSYNLHMCRRKTRRRNSNLGTLAICRNSGYTRGDSRVNPKNTMRPGPRVDRVRYTEWIFALLRCFEELEGAPPSVRGERTRRSRTRDQ